MKRRTTASSVRRFAPPDTPAVGETTEMKVKGLSILAIAALVFGCAGDPHPNHAFTAMEAFDSARIGSMVEVNGYLLKTGTNGLTTGQTLDKDHIDFKDGPLYIVADTGSCLRLNGLSERPTEYRDFKRGDRILIEFRGHYRAFTVDIDACSNNIPWSVCGILRESAIPNKTGQSVGMLTGTQSVDRIRYIEVWE